MPIYEIPLPVGAFNVKLRKAGTSNTYLIDIDSVGFTRVGEDGSVKILPLFGDDKFKGEILEGQWEKWWDGEFDGGGGFQPFTAIVDTTTGYLYLQGESDTLGTQGVGTLISKGLVPFIDEVEFTVAMSLPVDDTGSTASRDISIGCYLVKDYEYGESPYQDNLIQMLLFADENGFQIQVAKRVDGSWYYLHLGPDADTNDSSKSTGDLEACIFRVVFNDAIPDAEFPRNKKHMHVYLKQSDTLANAESATEKELVGSPYDISDLLQTAGFPALLCTSEQQTYFDSGGEGKFAYVSVEYPDMDVLYELDNGITDQLKNECEIWDGDPDSGGVKVYDKDHEFANDVYIQNGLVRMQIDEAAVYGLIASWYESGVGYTGSFTKIYQYLRSDSLNMRYPFFNRIHYLSPEKIVIDVKLCNSTADDEDYYLINRITLRRGSYSFEIELDQIYPVQEVQVGLFGATDARFSYGGNGELCDGEVASGTANNSTMDDNFMILFDEDIDAVLGSLSFTVIDTVFRADSYYILQRYLERGQKYWLHHTPYSLIAELFVEAEDANTNGDIVADGDASGGQAVELDAANENINFSLTAGTDIQKGRYLFLVRAKDSSQEALAFVMRIRNTTDSNAYRNEEGVYQNKTLTASYVFYPMVFDITQDDVDDGDNIQFYVNASGGLSSDTITVDDFLIIPLGNGESYPMDLAHNVLRETGKKRRVVKK